MSTLRKLMFKTGVLFQELIAGAGDRIDNSLLLFVPIVVTTTTYTNVLSDNGYPIELSNSAAIAVTLSATMPQGFNCMFMQYGAGQATFTVASGAILRQASSLTKTRAQYSLVSAYVRANTSGAAAEWVLGGDMA